jgi:hypothetical protein
MLVQGWSVACFALVAAPSPTYTFHIYLRSQLRIYWRYFYFLCSQHVSAPKGHLQVKYNYNGSVVISMSFPRYVSDVIVFHQKMNMFWTVKIKVTPINSQLWSQVYLKGIRIYITQQDTPQGWNSRSTNHTPFLQSIFTVLRSIKPHICSLLLRRMNRNHSSAPLL